MTMERVYTFLPPELLESLDKEAENLNMRRSALIRMKLSQTTGDD